MNRNGLILVFALLLVLAFTATAMAHPRVQPVDLPMQSLERLDSGIHKAYMNVNDNSNGIAKHNMYYRFQFEKFHGSD